MKSFEEQIKMWKSLSHISIIDREAAFFCLAIKKFYSRHAINIFIIRYLRAINYSI